MPRARKRGFQAEVTTSAKALTLERVGYGPITEIRLMKLE